VVDRLWISPHVVTVADDGPACEALQARGVSFIDRNLICLHPDVTGTARAETLLHECLHLLWHNAGLGADEFLADVEERVVTALAPRLLALLVENPKLVETLWELERT